MSERGFTLVEILAALVIFALLFLPLTGVLIAESRLTTKSERKRTAILVACNELEKIKKTGLEKDLDSREVVMGGMTWEVTRTRLQGERLDIGAGNSLEFYPVTVAVSKSGDTATLAEFTVFTEPYR